VNIKIEPGQKENVDLVGRYFRVISASAAFELKFGTERLTLNEGDEFEHPFQRLNFRNLSNDVNLYVEYYANNFPLRRNLNGRHPSLAPVPTEVTLAPGEDSGVLLGNDGFTRRNHIIIWNGSADEDLEVYAEAFLAPVGIVPFRTSWTTITDANLYVLNPDTNAGNNRAVISEFFYIT